MIDPVKDPELWERQQAMDEEARRRGVVIGRATPVGPARGMVYVGKREELRGEGAMVAENGAAQFNNHDTKMGYGWWSFKPTDFERTRPSKDIPEHFRKFVFRRMK